MTLRSYQRTVELNTLYEIAKLGGVSGAETIEPFIWINSGAVDIRSSSTEADPNTLTLADMTLNTENTNLSGHQPFYSFGNYIAIIQNTGTTTEITLSGVEIKQNLGAIS